MRKGINTRNPFIFIPTQYGVFFHLLQVCALMSAGSTGLRNVADHGDGGPRGQQPVDEADGHRAKRSKRCTVIRHRTRTQSVSCKFFIETYRFLLDLRKYIG